MDEYFLPCPFCGGEAGPIMEEDDDDGDLVRFVIYCQAQGCGGQAEGVEPGYAVETWNRRSTSGE